MAGPPACRSRPMLTLPPPDLGQVPRLDELLAHTRDGLVLGAFRRFYAPDVRCQENDGEPTLGFTANLCRVRSFLAGIGRWHGFAVLAKAAVGDHTIHESLAAWTTTTGQRVRRRQIVISRWRDGRIIDERCRWSGEG